MPHGMRYSHFVNEVCNRAKSIRQQGFINDRCKVNPVGQRGKVLVMTMGQWGNLVHCTNTDGPQQDLYTTNFDLAID